MPQLLNFDLLKEPVNWLIVGAILALLAFSVHSVLPLFTTLPSQQ